MKLPRIGDQYLLLGLAVIALAAARPAPQDATVQVATATFAAPEAALQATCAVPAETLARLHADNRAELDLRLGVPRSFRVAGNMHRR